MSNQVNTKLGLFQQAAARSQRTLQAEIDVDVVRRVRPAWTERQAVAFLAEHRERIAERMLEAGIAAVIALVDGGSHAH
jgi:hypothetical protein